LGTKSYSYTFGDPINSSDPTGAYAATISTALTEALSHEAEAAAAAREAAARATAEKAALEAAQAAAQAGPQYAEEAEEWEEWYEEENEYEYAAFHRGGKAVGEEVHAESAVWLVPLSGEEGGENGTLFGSVVPLCEAGSTGLCARDIKGGPGAFCGSNSTEHRRCGHTHGHNGGGGSVPQWVRCAGGAIAAVLVSEIPVIDIAAGDAAAAGCVAAGSQSPGDVSPETYRK
jgi:hypothetical protein